MRLLHIEVLFMEGVEASFQHPHCRGNWLEIYEDASLVDEGYVSYSAELPASYAIILQFQNFQYFLDTEQQSALQSTKFTNR